MWVVQFPTERSRTLCDQKTLAASHPRLPYLVRTEVGHRVRHGRRQILFRNYSSKTIRGDLIEKSEEVLGGCYAGLPGLGLMHEERPDSLFPVAFFPVATRLHAVGRALRPGTRDPSRVGSDPPRSIVLQEVASQGLEPDTPQQTRR